MAGAAAAHGSADCCSRPIARGGLARDANRDSGEKRLVHRRLICCVLAIEITGHDRHAVFDQIRITQALRQLLVDATAAVPEHDLISIPREDGALLGFVADAAACFEAALAVREACLADERYADMQPRIGIDLGPVEVLQEELGEAYLGGDGRRDAERLMRQGPPCQVSVTRSFFELLARASPELASGLKYQGLLSDTMGRPLGWYNLDPASARLPRGSSAQDATARVEDSCAPAKPQRQTRLALAPVALALALLVSLPADAPVPPPSHEAGAALAARLASPDFVAPGSDSVQAVPVPRVAKTPPAAPRSTAKVMQRKPGEVSALPAPARAAHGANLAALPPANLPQAGERPPEVLRSKAPSSAVSVRLAVRPWGEVQVNGRDAGITPPLKALRLAPGRYVVTVRNGTLPALRRELLVRPGSEPVTLAHDFGCVAMRDIRCPESNDTPLLSSSRYRPKTTRDRTAQAAALGREGRPALAAAAGTRAPPAPLGAVAAR